MSDYFLDGNLFYLGQETDTGGFAVVLLETANKKAFPIFTQQDVAQQLFPDQSISCLHKDDPRAKEECFRAVLNAGATEVWVDGLQPTTVLPLEQALHYILSFKNQSACF
ncbi:MAG: hypothetical protein ACRCYY_12075 [Trueperaceae bacterium]